jgi:uroporphyrin-III C-methyltransferase
VECELKIAKKKPGCAEEAQGEIYEWAKHALDEGKNVVRLKIGDPFLFGRGGEEILEFRKYGYEPVVAPGISSSYCAPLIAGIPLTHRGVSSQVIISTGKSGYIWFMICRFK